MIDNKHLKNSNNKIQTLVFLIGFFTNISKVIAGINISVSDIFFVILLFFLVINRYISLKKNHLLFFILLIIYRLVVSIILPSFIPIELLTSTLLINVQKIIVGIAYFLIFYSLISENNNYKIYFYNGLRYGGLVLGSLSIIIFFLAPQTIKSIILYENMRLIGGMNDPNYFAFLQLCGLFLWMNKLKQSKLKKCIIIIIYITTILLSASKTALIALIIVIIFNYLKKIKNIKKKQLVKFSFFIFIFTILYVFFGDYIIFNFYKLIQFSPQISRLITIFQNGESVVNSGGSDRLVVWQSAISLIENTRGLGIGFFNYGDVLYTIKGSRVIAHNTILQISVEWGAGITIFSLIILIYTLLKKRQNVSTDLNYIILITIIFCMSLSLQNTRIFWILLAILFYEYNLRKENI